VLRDCEPAFWSAAVLSLFYPRLFWVKYMHLCLYINDLCSLWGDA